MLKNKSLVTFLITLMFFIQYLGVGVYAHILIILLILVHILNYRFYPITNFDAIFVLTVIFIFLIKALNIPPLDSFLVFKFYFGFILFYIFFKISKFQIDYRYLFIITCIVSIIDFTLINTFVPIETMKNIPGGEMNISAKELRGAFYRSYGLGSSPTVSATIIVVLLASIFYYQRKQYKDKYILFSIIPLLMFGSGTGFFLFFLFLFMRYKLYKGKKILFGILILIIFIITITLIDQNENGGLLSRISIVYYNFLIDLKLEQINEVLVKLDNSIIQTLFGYSYKPDEGLRIMSDFGWLDMLEACGYVGIILLWIFVIIKKKFKTPVVLLFMIGAFHYPALFSIPGQILIGALLAAECQNVSTENKNILQCENKL